MCIMMILKNTSVYNYDNTIYFCIITIIHRHLYNDDSTECICIITGAQWLSGRVLDSRPRGRGFEPHRRHCVVVIEYDTFILA